MNRIKSAFIVAVLLSSMLALCWQAEATEIKSYVFEEDFDSYTVGTFPYAYGWELVFNGAGNSQQVVTNAQSNSDPNSLKLLGRSTWSANVQKLFNASSNVIGYEAYVRTENNESTKSCVASLGFWNREASTWGKRYANTYFENDGMIYAGPNHAAERILIGPYEPNVWYKVACIVDKSAETCSFWLNDELVVDSVPAADTDEIKAMMLESGHASVRIYFDNVNVFEMLEVTSILNTSDVSGAVKSSFSPGETIYATGSGYQPNTNYNVYVVEDTTWTAGMDIPAATTTTSITTDNFGNISPNSIYQNAQIGTYDVILDANNNGQYDPETDTLCDNIVATTAGFLVIPEYTYGALITIAACLAAFALFNKNKKQT